MDILRHAEYAVYPPITGIIIHSKPISMSEDASKAMDVGDGNRGESTDPLQGSHFSHGFVRGINRKRDSHEEAAQSRYLLVCTL